MRDEESWGDDARVGADSADDRGDDRSTGRERPGTGSLLEGFAEGGLAGLLDAMDDRARSRGDLVDDPEALRRAEEAVARDPVGWSGAPEPVEESWAPIATQAGETLIGGLQAVAVALQSAGIPVGWDPYDPRRAPGFLPPIMGTQGRTFTLLVPESRAADARDALRDVRPDGVAFAWESGAAQHSADSAGRAGSVSAGEDTDESGSGFRSSSAGPTQITGGPAYSDNARLERAAATRPSGCGALLAAAAVVVILLSIVYLLLRG